MKTNLLKQSILKFFHQDTTWNPLPLKFLNNQQIFGSISSLYIYAYLCLLFP